MQKGPSLILYLKFSIIQDGLGSFYILSFPYFTWFAIEKEKLKRKLKKTSKKEKLQRWKSKQKKGLQNF